MYTDKSLYLCENTDFFGGAGNAFIGDVLGWKGREDLLGAGKPLALVIQISRAMVGGTTAKFRFTSSSGLSGQTLP